MYRVELIDGRIEWMDAEAVSHYAGIIKAFVLDEPTDFEGEVERLFSELEPGSARTLTAVAS
ncbi:MAG: hypothetical protein IPK07_31170 [Deltaproteobacteria bacterium]|nr:hypothetical protein [Deltaproteobacteria bacterium]